MTCDHLEPQVQSEGLEVSVMAFAEDLILTTSSFEGLVVHLKNLEKFLRARLLEANAEKSSSLVILPSRW